MARELLGQSARRDLEHRRERLRRLASLLESLSPLATLGRGYALLSDDDGRLLRRADAVSVGDPLEARLARGRLGLRVERVDNDG